MKDRHTHTFTRNNRLILITINNCDFSTLVSLKVIQMLNWKEEKSSVELSRFKSLPSFSLSPRPDSFRMYVNSPTGHLRPCCYWQKQTCSFKFLSPWRENAVIGWGTGDVTRRWGVCAQGDRQTWTRVPDSFGEEKQTSSKQRRPRSDRCH